MNLGPGPHKRRVSGRRLSQSGAGSWQARVASISRASAGSGDEAARPESGRSAQATEARLFGFVCSRRQAGSGQITPIYSKWLGGLSDEVPNLLEAMYILNSTPE